MAIYYQSFCDKLQDVLCNNVKNEIFKLFKQKYLYNTSKKVQRVSREIIYKRKELLTSIIEGKIEKKLLTILRKWKEIALKLKKRTAYKHLNQSWASKTSMVNKKTKNINNKESMHIKELKRKIDNVLSSTEKQVFELLVNDFTNEDIAKILKVDIKRIYNTTARIRSKIKDII